MEHPSGADEAVRLRNGIGGSQGLVAPVSGADAHHCHLGRLSQVQLPAQHRRRLGKAQALHPIRPADDQQSHAGFPGRLRLFPEASLTACLLGHQHLGIGRPQHGDVQFLRKGALHGNGPCRGESRLPAGSEAALHRQHPGIDPIRESGHILIGRQLLAAHGEEDVSRPLGQPLNRLLG